MNLALLAIAATVVGLVVATSASGRAEHVGGVSTTRYNAQWQVRDIMWDEYYWYVANVRCGSSTWTVGIHFPCTFNRLGRRYIVCYHSLDYDYGTVTDYQSWSCKKWY